MSVVTVTDRIEVSADVTQRQALAYVRRMLPAREGWAERDAGAAPWLVFERFVAGRLQSVTVPFRDDYADFPAEIAHLCDRLVRFGIASQPSEVLRAMAAEGCASCGAEWRSGVLKHATGCEAWERDVASR